jgi:hypothetical protein
MRSKLAVIAVSGFAVSAICLGGAFALGGSAIGDTILDIGDFGLPRCDVAGPSTATSRTLPWDGNGDRAAVAVVANTYYRAGSGDQLVVKGDPRIISHVYVRDGVVGIDCRDGNFHRSKAGRIEVTLPGRNFQTFEELGSGDMHLAGLSQAEAQISLKGSGDITADGKFDHLKILLAGSGDVTATGSAGSLHLDVRGSGDAKLGGLATKNADVDIAGSGDVEIAPRDAVNVDISGEGSGGVQAQGTTDNLKVEIHGSGDIKLGGLSAKNADVNIAGSGEAEIAPIDRLDVGIVGSGDVYLRTEPKKIDASIAGSGAIIHPDGARQDRRSLERHARADEAAIRAAAMDVVSHDGDKDELERAKARLKARIEARVAAELDRANVGPDPH